MVTEALKESESGSRAAPSAGSDDGLFSAFAGQPSREAVLAGVMADPHTGAAAPSMTPYDPRKFHPSAAHPVLPTVP